MSLTLAIETSCDETAVALFDAENKKLINHLVSSQVKLHASFGGVVPELSAREHTKNITPLLKELFLRTTFSWKDLDFISVTLTPGLILSLVVGVGVAKSIAHSLNIPLVPVHHLEGHIYSVFLTQKVEYPFIALIVSGGHTELYLVKDFGRYHLLGKTLDDSVGEAFDKVARLLGFPYPGGPYIDKLARKGKAVINFPKPRVKDKYNFSFSGLKTAVLHFIRKHPYYPKEDVAASFQKTVADILLDKTLKALRDLNIHRLVVVGGVSANSEIRKRFNNLRSKGIKIFFPPMEFTSDNAAMISYAGALRFERKKFAPLDINAIPNYPLEKFGLDWT